MDLFLAGRRSPQTRAAYRFDLGDFFGRDVEEEAVALFLASTPGEIAGRLAAYKGDLIGRGLAEATINRRLATMKSLLRLAHRMGCSTTDGRGIVESERSVGYRDTRGIPLAGMRALCELPDKESVKGKRDRALLRLFCENALRRGEVAALDVEDFDGEARTLAILGKGKGSEKANVTLSRAVTDAIREYLAAAGHADGALFRNRDPNPATCGRRITTAALYALVRAYGARIGAKLSPHRVRHSAITAALDALGGDIRKVQRFARHSNPATTALYDDARRQHQAEVSNRLSDLLG